MPSLLSYISRETKRGRFRSLLDSFGEQLDQQFIVFIFLKERWSQSSRAGSLWSVVKFFPLKYLQHEVNCYSLQFRSMAASKLPLLSPIFEIRTSLFRQMCVAKKIRDYSRDFFQKVLLISALLHYRFMQLTKNESEYLSKRQLMYPSNFCNSFLKGSALRQLNAIALKSFSPCLISSKKSTTSAALSSEQKHKTYTTRCITWENENWGAAETTVVKTLQTGQKTPSCLYLYVSIPTNSLNQHEQDPQREAKAYLVKTPCCEESVPKVAGLTVILFNHLLPLSRVSPKRRSSFLMQSAIQDDAWWQFLQTRCSFN